ncbi:hypothetical protein SLS62_001119 [Diatrype stigma]|uniref:Uncharacterized protein n=1 Tax=Diatrype stigma TaxID=117547 RepID=A0AAN9YRW7_9PEZI
MFDPGSPWPNSFLASSRSGAFLGSGPRRTSVPDDLGVERRRQPNSVLGGPRLGGALHVQGLLYPFAETDVHNVRNPALAALQTALCSGNGATVAEHIVHRGDLFLVMAPGERDLLRWCVALVLALQTRPWFREVDLWRSFVDVDLDFLEGLDIAWWGF